MCPIKALISFNSGILRKRNICWKEGTFLKLLDPTRRNSYSKNEVIRCIHMRLLCMQENHVHRPIMETIVLMLNSYSAILPPPQQPATHSHHNRTQSGTTTTRLI
ncbi:hypothetical protein CsatA_004684 [Cannabis sativa]